MLPFDKSMQCLLSLDILNQITNNAECSILKYNTLISILIDKGIPFDTEFTPGTRRDSPGIELTIYINPTTTIVFSITLGNGASVYTSD